MAQPSGGRGPAVATPVAASNRRQPWLRRMKLCCSHCGYPQRSLCCFGCSYTTRAIFVGSGGVIAGCGYLLLLFVLLICSGTAVLKDDPSATGFLVLGIIYLPMGFTLIYSAQTLNTSLLMPWIVLNFFFVCLEVIGIILTPILDSHNHFCRNSGVAIWTFVLQVFILGCRCYCIAIITHYRHRVLAAKAARNQREPLAV